VVVLVGSQVDGAVDDAGIAAQVDDDCGGVGEEGGCSDDGVVACVDTGGERLKMQVSEVAGGDVHTPVNVEDDVWIAHEERIGGEVAVGIRSGQILIVRVGDGRVA